MRVLMRSNLFEWANEIELIINSLEMSGINGNSGNKEDNESENNGPNQENENGINVINSGKVGTKNGNKEFDANECAQPSQRRMIETEQQKLYFDEAIPTIPANPGVLATNMSSIKYPAPYINPKGDLMLSAYSDPKYHWWARGQSVEQTLRELNAPPEIIKRYV
jgi:hypothetical protein